LRSTLSFPRASDGVVQCLASCEQTFARARTFVVIAPRAFVFFFFFFFFFFLVWFLATMLVVDLTHGA